MGKMVEYYSKNSWKWNKYDRKKAYKQKIKRLAMINLSSPAYPVGDYNFETRQWDNVKYYKREYRANHAPGYSGLLKKMASRTFRRYKGELPMKGYGYKKTFDYWRELY